MKRDMDLVREILLAVEAVGTWEELRGFELDFSDRYEKDLVDFHVWLLGEAGLLNVIDVSSNRRPYAAMPTCLTWQGYEFLDAARSPEVWSEANKQVKSTVGSVTLSVLTAVLIEVAKEKLGLR